MIDTNRSKQLWAICTRFGILPNDPQLLGLTPFQCLWIIANMNEEAEEHKRALAGDSDNYRIDSSNFDEGAYHALAGLAINGRNTEQS